jgi:hypothetical protein
MHVLLQLHTWLPVVRQHLWNSIVLTSATTVDVHSLCVHAGVDGIDFVLRSRQQRRACDYTCTVASLHVLWLGMPSLSRARSLCAARWYLL